jgi:hypothetical protein
LRSALSRTERAFRTGVSRRYGQDSRARSYVDHALSGTFPCRFQNLVPHEQEGRLRPSFQLFLLLALGMRLVAVLAGGLRMLLGIRRMLFALCVIAFAMVLGGGSMRFGGILVMFGCLIVFVFGHWLSPFVERTKVKLQRSVLVQRNNLAEALIACIRIKRMTR